MNAKLIATVLAVLCLNSGCRNRTSSVPAVNSTAYRELCSSFYLGLAALQSGEDVNARKGLTRATELGPGEPAAWVNLGLLQLRQQEDDAAYQSLQKARALAPENSAIENFLGLIESRRGKSSESLEHYRRAVALDGGNLRALYTLALEIERQQDPSSIAEATRLLDQILKLRPQNAPVLLDVIRLASRQNDAARLNAAISALAQAVPSWPPPAKESYARLQQAASAGDLRNAAIHAQFLRNTLLRELSFRRNLEEVKAPGNSLGDPFLHFLKLPSPTSDPAPMDGGVHFEQQAFKANSVQNVAWIGVLPLDEEKSAVVWMDAEGIHITDGKATRLVRLRSVSVQSQPGIHSVLGADLNYDFKTDLILVTQAGLRILQQEGEGQFVDVTSKASLSTQILNGTYTGAWAADFDLDGDLDIVLASAHGDPVVLRNNGDGTFKDVRPFQGADGVRSFVNADIDADGVPDAIFIDTAGKLLVFRNERLGSYRLRAVPSGLAEQNRAVAAGDINGDGLVDLVLLRTDLSITRLSDRDYGRAWDSAVIAHMDRPASGLIPGSLWLADMDNNGGLDVIAGNQVFLQDGSRFTTLPTRLPLQPYAVADLNADGRLDILGFSGNQTVIQLLNRGSKPYKWQVIRTRAATVMGDQRINPFGIGGEIEIRSGLLTQKQIIQSPFIHFGLGDHAGVDFARIVWPNGIIQTEFELKAEQSILAPQRLKGSCPFLFTWDGQRMRFLKDVAPMSAPIGAHIDANTLEPIEQTQQWFKIRGDQLVPRDGYYDVRLTNEYWETHYIDHYSLLVTDHPENSQVWVDERVAHPPAPLKVYVTGPLKSFRRATDDTGRNVSAVVQERDEKYLEGFGVGRYQGITRDHWLELELPEDAPRKGPLYLIGEGFIHPWDATVAIAQSQTKAKGPEDLSIQAIDETGAWVTARSHLGIPAGRLKSVVIEISNIFRPNAPRKLRLLTNLEVHWDRLGWAEGMPEDTPALQPAALSSAVLRYRGFSQLTQAGAAAPELADYHRVVRTGPQWRSLEGYYTSYGDVRELLDRIDDRMVIANSGDELRLQFRALPPPRPGYVRDFVFVGDGWIKEGDYNFRFSKTVLPLPYHGMRSYLVPFLPLEQDKAYTLHPADWQRFHNRYVAPEEFARAMWRTAQR